VGAVVGANVTAVMPAPEMAVCPVHALLAMQPSRMTYVCAAVPAGTVYCTCAHELPPLMHTAGGRSALPVSSYVTSTPAAVKTRITVMPEHLALGYSCGHMDTTNVCPALAVTPQVGSLSVSVAVLAAVHAPHSDRPVGASVGTTEGAAVGAVGRAVGRAVGWPATTVGLAEGSGVGRELGLIVVGTKVGTLDGAGVVVGTAIETAVGAAEPRAPEE